MMPTLEALLADHPEVRAVPGTDSYVVASVPLATEATVLQGCLVAAGVPAHIADGNLAQAYFGAVTALGGVRLMVPARYLRQAIDVLAAFERGDFALDDDTDVGSAEHDTPGASSR